MSFMKFIPYIQAEKVERKIMDGRETKYDDWKDGKSTHYQQIDLDENGITYGEVNWADTFYKRLSKTNKNELKKSLFLITQYFHFLLTKEEVISMNLIM